LSRSPSLRPLRPYRVWFALVVAAALSVAVLPWDLSHLATAEGWTSAWARVDTFVEGFAPPDLSRSTLTLATDLALETLAIAVLGVGLGLLLAYPLAVLASAATLDDGSRPVGWRAVLRATVRESFRFVLDALRGVPDFAWALVLLTIFGPTAVTAVLAIAVHVAGILGKILSELWDGVPRIHGEVLRGTGATRLQVLLYGSQPLAGRGMLSFLLMRFECAVRNASVIGAVCGGGLGGAIMQELSFGNKQRAVTLLLAALVVTVSADFASNTLRRLLRQERSSSLQQARRRRQLAGLAIATAVALSLFAIRAPILDLGQELARLDLRYLRQHYGQLLLPDLSAETLGDALRGLVVPLALGVLATIAASAIAAAMAWWGSASFQLHSQRFAPERRSLPVRAWRTALVLAMRVGSAVLRGIPEVAWVWILALFFLTGVEAALGALVLHSAGLLARVFTETVDNIPYRRLEDVSAPGRGTAFVYGALPLSRSDWRTYALFQFESNVRTGVVLGIVGIGGIGYLFRASLAHGAMNRASTFLLATVLLTVAIDRISRRIQRGPRC
jgi:phosphonate transport system permease protein